MNVSFFIARKYFLSRKKKNFINVISIISMLVVGIGTMALIIVLSVYNGLEDLLRSLYGDFDPHLVITPAEGKSFAFDDDMRAQLANLHGVALLSEVVEDNALVKYKNAERVVRLKGVSDNFLVQERLQQSILFGEPRFRDDKINYAIVGRGVQLALSINPNNDFYTMQVYYPRDIRPGNVDPSSLYSIRHIFPTAVFAVEKYYDDNYVYVPLEFAAELFDYGSKRTSLEIMCDGQTDPAQLKKSLLALLGDDYIIRVSDELHADLYKILKIEKFFLFIIFSLIIGIASINIYFSLTMLAIDKKRDMAVLTAQGASHTLIRTIFLSEGALIALSGAFTGLILGLAISYLQQTFGLIGMGMQSTLIDAYPIMVQPFDVLMTCLSIVIITVLASIQPARLAVKKLSLEDL